MALKTDNSDVVSFMHDPSRRDWVSAILQMMAVTIRLLSVAMSLHSLRPPAYRDLLGCM